jgi:hypothetical protein
VAMLGHTRYASKPRLNVRYVGVYVVLILGLFSSSPMYGAAYSTPALQG